MAETLVNILVLGSGGREHALLAKLAESPKAGKIWAAPGNGGTQGIAESVDLDIEDGAAVADFAEG
ncbi:phosphoribosylglycinamide synthetase, partial [gut metagenome]